MKIIVIKDRPKELLEQLTNVWETYKCSDYDEQGRPYPIIYMKLNSRLRFST